MAKTLCDWSKSDIEKKLQELREIVRNPRFYCRRCARVAHPAKVLCKPAKLTKEG
jgi:hypothetical protein